MEWFQQHITPPEVVEITARLGVVVSGDHVQWEVETKDPVTGILTAASSGPHYELGEVMAAMEDMLAKARHHLEAAVAPF